MESASIVVIVLNNDGDDDVCFQQKETISHSFFG